MLTINSRPAGLQYLYVAIAGHAFAWYTLYNLFVLWLVSRGHSDAAASSRFGDLVAAAYLLPLVGGMVASGCEFRIPSRLAHLLGTHSRFISTRDTATDVWQHGYMRYTFRLTPLGPTRTALVGGAVATVGYIAVTLSAANRLPIFPAVALVAFGVGLSKPNIAATVGRLFPSGSAHADAAFARYYSYINVGAVVSPLLGGYLAERFSFAAAFSCAVLGELVVVASLLLGRRHLVVAEQQSSLVALVGEVEQDGKMTTPRLPGDLADDHVGHADDIDAQKRRKLLALWIFFAIAAIGFWPAYSQNGSGLNLWALHHTDRSILGYNVPPTWFAAINSIICIVATVPLVRLFRNSSLSSSTAIGYLLMAGSFGTLVVAPAVTSHPGYLTISIILSSLSEVLISTVGLAQVSKLAPRHQQSTYMAVWFLTVAVGGKLAGIGGALPLVTGFRLLAVIALAAAVSTLLLRRWLDVAVDASGIAQKAVGNVVTTSNTMSTSSSILALPTRSGEVAS